MDPLGKLAEEDNIGSPDDTMSTVEPEVEYEARDPIPGVGKYNPIDEYFWMQQAIENNLANNELMIAIMVQMHNEYGWGGPTDYPPLDNARHEIPVVSPEQVFSDTKGD
jgi:hypothetical protein